MKKTQFVQIFFFVLSLILIALGVYFYFAEGISLRSTAFLRAGFLFLIAACFIRQILRLPRWTDIGWLPLAAAVISWKPFLLKFALPLSIILVFLNSPLARGKYRQKLWRNLGKQMRDHGMHKTGSAPNVPDADSTASNGTASNGSVPKDVPAAESVSAADPDFVRGSGCVSGKEKALESVSENSPADAANFNAGPEDVCASETANGPGSVGRSEKTDSETDPAPHPEVKIEILSEDEADEVRSEKKRSSSDVRGPNAKNVMFRAFSRVAGRQVGKVMQKVKEKGKD